MNKRQKRDAREIRAAARNVIAVYLMAEDIDRAAGALWYAEESARLADFAARHRISMDAACGAASAISPGIRWEFVPSHLAALIKNPKHSVPTYSRAFVDRALRCLKGEDPAEVIRGPKTRAFYRLLATAGGTDDVVIDGHAWNIARGIPAPIRGNVPAAGRVTDRRYRIAAAAYREAAEVLGEAPHAVQAITWCFWRRMLDRAAEKSA